MNVATEIFYSMFVRRLPDYRLRNAEKRNSFITQNLTKENADESNIEEENLIGLYFITQHSHSSSCWRFVFFYFNNARMCQKKVREKVIQFWFVNFTFAFSFLLLSGFMGLKKVRVDFMTTGCYSCYTNLTEFLMSLTVRQSTQLSC